MSQDINVSKMFFEQVCVSGTEFVAASSDTGSVNCIKIREFDSYIDIDEHDTAVDIAAILNHLKTAKGLDEKTYASLMVGLKPLVQDHYVSLEAIKNKLFPSSEDWASTATRGR